MIKTCHTRLKLTKSQTDLLDSMCDLYTKAKHTGFKLIARSNVMLFKNNINNLTTKAIITSLSSEQKKLLASKFNLTGRHNEWSIISNLYKTLQKDIYKENLQKEKLKSLMKSLPLLSNELDLSYLVRIVRRYTIPNSMGLQC